MRVAASSALYITGMLTQRQLQNLKVGDTLMLNATPDSEVSIRAGSIPLTTGRMGRKGQNIAIRVEAPISVEAAQSMRSRA